MAKKVPQLTDPGIRNAKSAEEKYILSDGGGLYLLVTPSGGKLWRFQYRINGKQRLKDLGAYPTVTLAGARALREELRALVKSGIDPIEHDRQKAEAKAQEEALLAFNTFEIVTREWHERFKKQWTVNHADRILKRLEQDVFPFIGARPIGEIKAPELLQVLRRIETRTLETAHRVNIACGQVFRYAVATGRDERDPVADLRGALPPVKKKHFAAPTDPKEVAPLLRAIDDYEGSFVVKCAMQLAPLVFVRPGELRKAEWVEIDFEAEQWSIPAEKMKMKESHLVPLSRQALEILKTLHPLTGNSKYIFPCQRSTLRCMSDNAVNAALRRMGFEKSEITGHGFRAMARTILDEVLQVRPDFIEHQLAHAVRDPNGRAYNRTAHLTERKKMMQTWADYLDKLKSGAKVIKLTERSSQ